MNVRAPSPDLAARTITGALRDIVAAGRKPLETADIPDATVVHDVRKALKHWRAMMRLVAPVVGKEAEEMRLQARDLGRQIAAARDGRAAQEAFSDVLKEAGALLPERTRAAVAELLARRRAGAEATGMTAAARANVTAMWKRAAAAIERWPLANFNHAEAARQLGTSYRRVCKAIPGDWSTANPDALHKLRRRVIEHRYQLEIAEPLWPKVLRVWVNEAQRLRERLGCHHDLAVLQHLAGPGQPLSQWASQLVPLIAARQAAHAAGARRLAGRLFAETPKAFLARMTALWEHGEREGDPS